MSKLNFLKKDKKLWFNIIFSLSLKLEFFEIEIRDIWDPALSDSFLLFS